MIIFEVGTIVWVPFPFVEMPKLRERPALVISSPWSAGMYQLQWMVMITSAANHGWPDDVSLIERYLECGLPNASVIRPAKVAAVEARQARHLGRLPDDLLDQIRLLLRQRLPLD